MLVSTPNSLISETQQNVPEHFYLDYIKEPNYNRVTRILAHALVKFEILLYSESKIIKHFAVYLHNKKETKERGKIKP